MLKPIDTRRLGRVHTAQCYSERMKLQMELLKLILEDSNLYKAIDRVVKNNGSGGIDKMIVIEVREYFHKHKEEIKDTLRKRTYKLNSIRRVEIPKQDDGKREYQ